MKTDREKLIDWLNETDHTWKTSEYLADYLISKGVTIPVRCAECVYYSETKARRCDHPQLEYDIECYDQWVETSPNDFCSYGERKEDVPDTKDGKYSEKPNSWKDRMLRTFLGRDR